MNLYIYSYNNYYNRIVKKEGNLITDYIDFLHYGPLQGVYGFTPGDGVNTKQIIGSNIAMYDGKGDYLIAHNPNTNEIDSRWFIIDVNRTRNGQWELTLHRDLVVDYYDLIIDSPMFIEKATLAANSPFIFNSENVQLNEIKKAEYLLENNLKTPWVVAYLSRYDGDGNYNTFNGEFIYENVSQEADYEVESIDEYDFSKFLNTTYTLGDEVSFVCNYVWDSDSLTYKSAYIELTSPGDLAAYLYGYSQDTTNWPIRASGKELRLADPGAVYGTLLEEYNNYNIVDDSGIIYNSITNVGTIEGFNRLAEENGKIIKVGDYYYRIKTAIRTNEMTYNRRKGIAYGTELYNLAELILVKSCGLTVTSSTRTPIYVNLPLYSTSVKLSLEPLENLQRTLKYNFDYSDGAVTSDAAYEIVATPLYDTTFTIGNNINVKNIGSFGLQWFQSMARKMSTKIFDVQIVPYIPIDTQDISIYKFTKLTEKNQDSNVYSIALQLPQSSFSLLLEKPTSATLSSNVKIGLETELWRITSPNGIGSFDFNPYKNKGWNFIEVDCTLLPINPYIKINPLFNPNGLYGGDYNDYRGLICNGDFSVALTSSEWQTYQQQNKNFQAIFDREIQTMEFKNRLGKTQDIASAIAGSFTGIASGALTGAVVGGGIGAIPGAIVGGIASAAGGIADVSINEQLRNEALDYTKDMFGLNLGNIKARADTLTKSTSYNINNKYFPYIEFFTCTEEEKRALANKIAYNGMSLGIIGKMTDYINNSWSYGDIKSQGYIKGQLIKLEFPINHKKQLHSEDFHVINAISNELYKGVYIK